MQSPSHLPCLGLVYDRFILRSLALEAAVPAAIPVRFAVQVCEERLVRSRNKHTAALQFAVMESSNDWIGQMDY
jgi:hypothetical protein